MHLDAHFGKQLTCVNFSGRFKVRQHLSGAASRNSRFFGNIRYGICNIYFKLIYLKSQIKILSNDMKHYVAAKKKNFCWTCKNKKRHFDNYSLREHNLLNLQ